MPHHLLLTRGAQIRALVLALCLLLVAAGFTPAAAAKPDAPGKPAQPGSAAKPDSPGKPAQPGNACGNRANNTYDKLLGCASVDGAMVHMRALQAIADANGGTRASGTPGYDASVDYVESQLLGAGYEVTRQEFDFPFYQELSPATLAISGTPFVEGEDFISMVYSGSGAVTAPTTGVDEDSATSGCEPEDFAGFPEGDIAVMQRGTCAFGVKALNAENAGASAAIIFNNAPDAFAGTLGSPAVTIPALGTSPEVGRALIAAEQATVTTDTISEVRQTENLFAETAWGRDDNVVMLGAHLDSVVAGPGINDNGSGSTGILEVALKAAKSGGENKLRFAWWGAEELGLLGSDHYVENLSDEERDDIALYLNYDMIASPNYVRFIYDGDGSAFGLEGPEGSAQIESLHEDFYGSRNLAWEPTQISFRSDYAAFFDFGIPFGGLFTGAEGVKTEAEQAIYGGTAGIAYDPCYHLACDDITNLSLEVFDLNIDAIAFTALTYAYSTESVNGERGKAVPGPRSDVFGARADAPKGAGDHTHSGGGGLHPERDPNHDHDHDGHDHHHDRDAA